MLVQCPSCHTTYKVSDSLITMPNPTFRCSRCKHIFVLGVKSDAKPVRAPAPPLSAPPRQNDEPELSLSFKASDSKETTEQKTAAAPAPMETKAEPTRPEPPKPPSDESFSFPDESPAPSVAKEEFPAKFEAEESLRLREEKEKEDNWSITAPRPEAEESFTMPEESRSTPADDASAPAGTLEDDWAESLPLLEERASDAALDPYRDRPLSVIPYVSLFGALLLAYALLTLMHQAQPKAIEAAIKPIPWLGSAVLKNNYLRYGITLQSLRPGFQTIQGNREVFVLSGVAVNHNPVSVREVRVEGHIFNAEGKEIDRQTISVGNAISSKILRDLTAQEISILQRLNPQKRFEIPPDESAAFVIVFLKPSAEVKNFSYRVLSAEGGV